MISASWCTTRSGARGSLRQAASTVGHPEPALDLAQDQQPAFRGQPAAVKPRDHLLALNR